MAESPEDAMVSSRRAASVLLEAEKFVQKREEALVLEIISRYRSGTTEHDFVVGRAAELSAGRHLLAEMRRAITQESKNG